MEHPTTLIYLADAETLGQLHQDWPSDLRVALCLEEGGTSDVVFLRSDNIDEAPARVAALLGRDDADFVFVPLLGGYPTRRLSFWQEQQLCGVLADMVDLPDQARASFPGTSGKDAGKDDGGSAEIAVPAKPAVTTRSVQARPAPILEASEGITGRWGYVERSGAVWRFTIDAAGQGGSEDPVVFAHAVGLSDDRRRLQAVLALTPEAEGQAPEAFQMPVSGLPPGCPDLPTGIPHRVFLRFERAALTITLPVQKPVVQPETQTKPGKTRRFGLLGPAVAAATALVMVQVGTSQEAVDVMRAAGTFQDGLPDK